jgi:hypothetical protein
MSKMLFETDSAKFARTSLAARGYHRRAELFTQQGQPGGLVFNVASIAVECYLIALCAFYGSMPFNHNYGSLMDSAEEVIKFDPQLSADIRDLDKIFGICSLDNYYHGTPTDQDAEDIMSICSKLSLMLDKLSQQTAV